jgi:hypothetical protein
VTETSCLKCFTCNSLLQAGCAEPLKSDHYFLQNCEQGTFCTVSYTLNVILNFDFWNFFFKSTLQQRTTTRQDGYKYLERGCAMSCSSQTNGLYNSNIQSYSNTAVNQCCQTDGCNLASHLISNKLNLFFVLLVNLVVFIFIF